LDFSGTFSGYSSVLVGLFESVGLIVNCSLWHLCVGAFFYFSVFWLSLLLLLLLLAMLY
jgi:hypothetical protein